MTIKAVVVDDEQLAINKIRRYLNKIPYIELMDSFTNPVHFLSYYKNNEVDLLFLDIQMDDINGIELLEHISHQPKVILTTAYDHYTLKGFEIGVCDYLLKPISFNRFLKAVEKAQKEILTDQKAEKYIAGGTQKKSSRFVYLKSGKQNIKTYIDDILYIEGMKDYLAVNTKEKKILVLQNFNSLLNLLDSNNLVRVHKSYVVALNKIEVFNKNSVIIGQKEIPISKMFKDAFNSKMKIVNS